MFAEDGGGSGHVHRVEAFMRANGCTPLTIAEITEAAGCSVRALQIAFRRFRGTAAMQVLQQARLEQALSEMLRGGQTDSLARIAAEHGFSSPTRFASSSGANTASIRRRCCGRSA